MSNQSAIQFVPVKSLHFDPKNPRLPSSVDGNNERAVIAYMLRDATIIELMGAIGEKGYFPGEPLLVIPDKSQIGDYVVVEGNRRLTAVKLLISPDLAPVRKNSVETISNEAKEKPETLPILIFNAREDILDYLGYRHVTGVKEWDSLAKTRYLSQLLSNLPPGDVQDQYKALAKIIGSRSDYVAKMLTGLSIYNRIVENDFFGIRNLSEESIDFSVLTTALGYGNIQKFLGISSNQDRELKNLNQENLKNLTSWLFEKHDQGRTRLGESRMLIQLNKVVGNQRALASFKDGASLKEAVVLTEEPNEIFRISIIESKSRLETARDVFHLVDSVTTSESENLLNIARISRNLKSNVDDKITGEE